MLPLDLPKVRKPKRDAPPNPHDFWLCKKCGARMHEPTELPDGTHTFDVCEDCLEEGMCG